MAILRSRFNFSENEVNNLTYGEADRYCRHYLKTENDREQRLLKLNAFYILESVRVASHGNNKQVKKHINALLKTINEEEQQEENDIEQQFKDINFG